MDNQKNKIAIFGGSFDPPHVGHVLAVHYVLLTSPVQKVLVIPCGRHAFGKGCVDFYHRIAMCRLAFDRLAPDAVVSDIEGHSDKPSYTVDTVRKLRRVHPDHAFELIVGTDILDEMDQWKEADALREMVTLRVLPRLGETEQATDKETPFYLPQVSSTTIRRMLARSALGGTIGDNKLGAGLGLSQLGVLTLVKG